MHITLKLLCGACHYHFGGAIATEMLITLAKWQAAPCQYIDYLYTLLTSFQSDWNRNRIQFNLGAMLLSDESKAAVLLRPEL